MIKKKETNKLSNALFYFALFLIFAFLSVGIVTADTSVAWTKDIGDVLAADMAEDGSIVYAAIADGADSTLYVYDSQGTEQNTFSISGAVQEIVCTADGSKAALYTDGNEVYYIDDGQITWTEQFTDITDIDISDVGNVLIVESDIFHKYLSNGNLDYNSTAGTFDLGVIDPNDDYAIIQSGTSKLDKYVISTTNDYWGKINENSFNTNFSEYQNVLILYTSNTTAIILNNTTLGDELWDEIYSHLGSDNQYYGITDDSLIQTNAYQYYLGNGVDDYTWTQATSSAQWSARSQAVSWVYNDLMWIGCGYNGNINFNDVWYSSDGISWTQATSSAQWSARRSASSWVYNNLMWIGGGYDTNYKNDVWYSSDGISWTRATSSAQWSARIQAVTWVYNNLMWIGGGTASSRRNDVWYSSDGISWTQATSSAQWSVRRGACSWVYNNLMWIGGGYDSNYKKDVWYSSDGISWTQATSSAQWSARFQAVTWVYNNRMWIGGGDESNYKNDVWYLDLLSDRYLVIQPSSTGQTWLFYNYQGSSPQHTQTTYASSVDFTGTTELRTKPELSIYQYQASKTYTGAIESLSVSDAGDWLGTATASRVYHDQITSEGFGTSYNAVLGSEGTVYDIATANEAAMSVIGQGQYTDIYSQIAARVGTYTAGGDIQHVDIAGNALWATSGGSDGKMYLFSKDQSSNWYLEYSSESGDPITALKMAASGSYILAGRTDGLTFYQQTSPSPEPSSNTFWFTLYAYKDSDSYRNAGINVSVYNNNLWSPFAQGVTDSVGKYVIQLTAGQSYKFDIGNGEKILIYQASPSIISQTVSIYTTPISSALKYGAEWNSETNSIDFDYSDSAAQTQSVTVRIQRTDNWDTVYENTFSNQQNIEETLPILDDTVTYKVEFSARRVQGVSRNTFFVSSGNDIIPIPLDQNLKNVIFSCFLILLAGLFSYFSAIRGAIVVALAAVFFVYLGWLTIPWQWLIVAIVIALLAGFTQRRS